jgi:hypothetical protein
MRDIDIRRALRVEMQRRHVGETDIRFIEELGVCQGSARVDFAVVNGRVHGYEIKSERDTLTRLRSQADFYSEALEYVTIIAAPHHLNQIGEIVPDWWGVWSATQRKDEIHFDTVQEARPNPSVSSHALVQFLWRDEALAILAEHSLAVGMSSKSRQLLWERLSKSFTVEELAGFVRARLKQRGEDWRALSLQA